MIHGGLSIHPRILPYYCIRVWGLYMYIYTVCMEYAQVCSMYTHTMIC